MKNIKFDFNNMFDFNIGRIHGVTETDLKKIARKAGNAHEHLLSIMKNAQTRLSVGLEWTQLPFQDKQILQRIKHIGKEFSDHYEHIIFLGIGGSYLGLKAAQDALVSPYYNEFSSVRGGRPKIYFEGNNIDPATINVLLHNLNPRKTGVVVISKSGETTETKVGFDIVAAWLKKTCGEKYGRHIVAITDPCAGTLRRKVDEAQKRDSLSFRHFPLYPGVGGRFSEFNMGLFHLAVIGAAVEEVLAGAADMYRRCTIADMYKNPAQLYAVLHTILYTQKRKPLAVIMPFGERLKSTADWYAQLLAESVGKKYQRIIVKTPDGKEAWIDDVKKIIQYGRTPVPCRGTNDLHSIQQEIMEGENNKIITFLRIEHAAHDLIVPQTGDFLAGRTYTELLCLAQQATEWAVVQEQRPNNTIIIPELRPYTWGQLLFFFEMATAYEGELANINAYNQPGVESYKNYMYYKLGKAGVSEKVAQAIKKNPLKKQKKYIV